MAEADSWRNPGKHEPSSRSPRLEALEPSPYISKEVCRVKQILNYMHIYIYYVCIYMYISICMYVCIYILLYTHIHIRSLLLPRWGPRFARMPMGLQCAALGLRLQGFKLSGLEFGVGLGLPTWIPSSGRLWEKSAPWTAWIDGVPDVQDFKEWSRKTPHTALSPNPRDRQLYSSGRSRNPLKEPV